MINIKDKIALVTGASRGLGRAIAVALAKSGANVIVNYNKSKEAAKEVVTEIQKIGVSAEPVQADISQQADVQNLAKHVKQKYGGVDILVNNAGAIIRPGNWNILTGNDFNYTIDLNLKSTIYCIQEFAPLMIERKWGRILNLTTTYAITGGAAVLAYTTAKAGIISLTYAMARELGKNNITVNAIAPGNFDTDMSREAGDAVNNWAIETTPLGRLGRSDEIGEAAVFLITSEFITGHILVVDGGQILNM